MTAFEYMEKQLQKHRLNYKRESERGVPKEVLLNIERKIGYYEAAVDALKVVRCKDCVHGKPYEERINVADLYKESWEWCEYQPMLNAFGKIVLQVDDIAYQGDSRVLYDNCGKIGVLIFGWGSCSGCDALQACNSLKDVQELCDELQDSIRWFDDKKSALEYFKNHDWEGDFFGLEEETVRFVSKGIKYLSGDKSDEKDGEEA